MAISMPARARGLQTGRGAMPGAAPEGGRAMRPGGDGPAGGRGARAGAGGGGSQRARSRSANSAVQWRLSAVLS